jgi:toxin ParE1/3/4
MTQKFVLSKRAESDLRKVKTDSLKKWGEEKTKVYLLHLESRMQWLADNPNLGKSRDEVRTGLRSFPEGKHVVFYRLGLDCIEVAGVPHHRRELQRFFQEVKSPRALSNMK